MDDTTNGTAADATAADLAATVTGTATFGSAVNLGSPTNTFGTIALNTSGAGTVNSTLMRADDITGNSVPAVLMLLLLRVMMSL